MLYRSSSLPDCFRIFKSHEDIVFGRGGGVAEIFSLGEVAGYGGGKSTAGAVRRSSFEPCSLKEFDLASGVGAEHVCGLGKMSAGDNYILSAHLMQPNRRCRHFFGGGHGKAGQHGGLVDVGSNHVGERQKS